ncbi:MAG: hypothetical protein ACKPAH_03245 [Verrucomicrobiota bacterium]
MPAPSPLMEDPAVAPAVSRKAAAQVTSYKKVRPGTPKEAELIEQYLPFVKNVVGRLALSLPAHVDLDDLYSAVVPRHFQWNRGGLTATG